MSQEWYYSVDGDRQGPVGAADLKKLADAGTLKPADLVWKDGMADWAQAKSIKGLFGGSAPKSGEQPVAAKPQPVPAAEERPSARGRPRDDDEDDRPRRRRDEDADDDRPRRRRDEDEDRPRSRRRDEDEDEDRPVRRRDEDQDDDEVEDRPRRKKSRVPEEAASKKMTTAILAIVLGVLGFGWIGIHKFMLGKTQAGLIYLLGSVLTCFIGAIVFNIFSIIDGVIYLTKSDEEFYETYVIGDKQWF